MTELSSKIDQKLKTSFVEVPPPLDESQLWGEKAWHKNRKAGHTASKMALALLVNPFGETEITPQFLEWFNQKALNVLEEKNYHVLAASNSLCSRSHTTDLACAALLPPDSAHLSIGIDLEAKDRPIPSNLKRFMEHSNDRVGQTSSLRLWCLKEACFKALSSWLHFQGPSEQRKLVLTDIQIWKDKKEHYGFSYKSSDIEYLGEAEIQVLKKNDREFYCSVAILKKA